MLKYLLVLTSLLVVSWEDHPDVEDHKETDRIYRLAQLQTGAAEYEAKMIDDEIKNYLKNLNRSKFYKDPQPDTKKGQQ